MSKAFYIPDFYVVNIGFNALNKSREDLIKIYQKLNFECLYDKKININDEKLKFYASNVQILGDYVNQIINQIDSKCQKGDFLFMDFPFSIKFIGYNKIVSYATTKGVKVVFFIHDLDGIRFTNPIMNVTDSSCLDMAYCLISASKEMNKVLLETLRVSSKVKIVEYNYWDYLTPDIKNENINADVCFAGNLKKSNFLSLVPDELVNAGFNMYGKGMTGEYRGNYCGEYNPEELVSVLDGKYGLVWDGKSEKTCSGNFGKYLKINSSHKFALYMATNKPVIVWKQSTLADFVEKNNIGIAVSSLNEIVPVLSYIDYSHYLIMRKNVSRIREDVISGRHLSKVILSSMN